MKTTLTIVLFFLSYWINCQDFANYSKYREDNLKLIESKKNVKTIFMGDSITEFWSVSNPDFFIKNEIINRGISGQTTSQMLLRFQQDVIDLKPTHVVLLCGINDIAENTGPISIENIVKNISSMIELAKYNKIKVTLSSVLPAAYFPWRKEIQPANKVVELNNKLKLIAKKYKIGYIDYHTIMKDERNGLPRIYADDDVHPTKLGYQKMEGIISKYIQ